MHASANIHRREVGATLHVVTADGEPASHNSALQWLRQVAGVTELEVIAGAVRCQARLSSGYHAPSVIMAGSCLAATVAASLPKYSLGLLAKDED